MGCGYSERTILLLAILSVIAMITERVAIPLRENTHSMVPELSLIHI